MSFSSEEEAEAHTIDIRKWKVMVHGGESQSHGNWIQRTIVAGKICNHWIILSNLLIRRSDRRRAGTQINQPLHSDSQKAIWESRWETKITRL